MGRKLRPDEVDLWDKVKETAVPLNPVRPMIDFGLPDEVQPAKKIPESSPPEPLLPFRLGSRAKTQTAPAPVKTGGPVMDAKTFGKMSRGRLAPEARIDLHGMTVAEAHPALVDFILTSAQRNLRLVLVITGKGKSKPAPGPIPERIGVLRQSLPSWLRQAPLTHLVMEYKAAHQKHGGQGAFYVYLRRRRG